MNRLRGFLGALGPIIVIGALIAFVAYALVLYKSSDRLGCGNFVMRQADVAVHVIRQWAGKEGTDYAGCTTAQ